jgi:CxxC-x17-CxxC domain-containing protein
VSQQTSTEVKCIDCGKITTVPFKPTACDPVLEVEWKRGAKNLTAKNRLCLGEEKTGKTKDRRTKL